MPTPRYAVKDWAKHYETAETRKLINLRWVPIPNKHDGLGYRRVAAQEDAAELFCAWILILQVCSRGRPEERGHLLRDQEVLGANHLAMMTGFPADVFDRALKFFSSPQQGWLVIEEQMDLKYPAFAGDSPALPADAPAEGKGREGKVLNGTLAAVRHERNLLIDALCLVEGIPLDEIGTAGGRLGAALKTIKASSPDVTPEDIAERAVNYRTHFNGAALTAMALSKHWGKCHEANQEPVKTYGNQKKAGFA